MKKSKFLFSLISLTLLLSSCVSPNPASEEEEETWPEDHEHTFSNEWSYDETYHWHASTCGHKVVSDKNTHQLSGWVISSDGLHRERKCNICSFTQTDKYEEDKVFSFELINNQYYSVSAYITTISGDIVIPNTYNGLPVKEIAEYGFSGCNLITSITIPSSITTINKSAFFQTYALEAYIFEVEDIEKYMTLKGKETGTIDFSREIRLIDKNGNEIKNVVINEGTTIIPKHAFAALHNVETIVLPHSLTEIGQDSFSNCWSLSSITIPENVNKIGNMAFYGCSHLVEVINKSALRFELDSPNDGYIAKYAYQIIDNETESKLSTDEDGFVIYSDTDKQTLVYYKGNSDNIIVHDGVTDIKTEAFFRVKNEAKLILPSSIKVIEKGLTYRSNIIGIYFKIDSFEQYLAIDGHINKGTSIDCGLHFLDENNKEIVNVVVPNNVKEIPQFAFSSAHNVQSVSLPEGLTTIEGAAFQECFSLTKITIPSTVTSFANAIFLMCYRLKEVINKSSMENLNIPDYVSIIKDESESKLSKDENGFVTYRDDDNICLVGYFGKLEEINLPSNITRINQYALAFNDHLTSININSGVTYYEGGAFERCTKLVSIDIPEGPTEIPAMFGNCTSLTTIGIPHSVKTIKSFKFFYMPAFSRVNYAGTKEEWKIVGANIGKTIKLVHCLDGDLIDFVGY